MHALFFVICTATHETMAKMACCHERCWPFAGFPSHWRSVGGVGSTCFNSCQLAAVTSHQTSMCNCIVASLHYAQAVAPLSSHLLCNLWCMHVHMALAIFSRFSSTTVLLAASTRSCQMCMILSLSHCQLHLYIGSPIGLSNVVLQELLQNGSGSKARSELKSGCPSRRRPHLPSQSGHPVCHK